MAGNYFHSRAISGFIMCLAGQIQVKCDNSKLKTQAFAGRMWPAGRMLPHPGLASISKESFLVYWLKSQNQVYIACPN